MGYPNKKLRNLRTGLYHCRSTSGIQFGNLESNDRCISICLLGGPGFSVGPWKLTIDWLGSSRTSVAPKATNSHIRHNLACCFYFQDLCTKCVSGFCWFMEDLILKLIIFAGCIKIDGIDISCVTLDRLRKAISIIPQDPILFSGTIR